jgi:Putative prokaryotic signal transducing protein
MEELLRTNDVVLISFVEALLRDADIGHFVADQNTSAVEGSLGFLPRRIMVNGDQLEQARRLLTDAGIGGELGRPKGAA